MRPWLRSRRLFLGALVGVLALAVLAALLPPGAARVEAPGADRLTFVGSLHVHTRRSDGAGSTDDVAAAARRAGLDFVVITDHGDGTREPDAPAYRDGVLCIDAVEISTTGGHYVALGLGRAPYRLAGEARDVVEDVARLGGFGVAAHPGSSRDELRWQDWTAPIDALEWLNADSEWRDEGLTSVARALATYAFRGPETIAAVFDRPEAVLSRWDRLARERRVIGLAGHDAHARIGLRGNWEPGERDISLRLPSYEAAFRTFAVRVRLAHTPTGNAARDAGLVLSALRAGHAYTAVDALATPASLDFEAHAGPARAAAGDDLVTGGAARLEARTLPAPGVSLVLLRDGRPVRQSEGPLLTYDHPGSQESTVYRVEARLLRAPGRPAVPWIVGNPIVIGTAARGRVMARELPPVVALRPLFETAARERWRVEHDARSRARVEVRTAPWARRALRLEFALAGGAPSGQYAALVATPGLGSFAGWDRVSFLASADRQMRLSVQVRAPESGRRWLRSVVVDAEPRRLTVPWNDMSPAHGESHGQVPVEQLDSLLFVVDSTNTSPATSGVVWVDGVRFEKAGESQVRTVSRR